MTTRFQLHCQNWNDGCGSEFCDGARKKTFFRGSSIPCDILFVGEAPGKSENVAGIPFAPGAPAGKLLTGIVKKALGDKPYTIGFTNVVACIPRREDEEKIEPEADQIELCKPRLEEIIDIAKPKMIFAVGSLSRDALTQGYLHSTKIPEGCVVHHIVHPAWILRQTTAFQGLEIQRVVCEIQDAIRQYEKPVKKLDIPAGGFGKKPGLKPKKPTPTTKSGILDPAVDEELPF